MSQDIEGAFDAWQAEYLAGGDDVLIVSDLQSAFSAGAAYAMRYGMSAAAIQEIEELKHDLSRYADINSELATENEDLRVEVAIARG